MDMSNIPLGDIVAPNVDVGPINRAIKDRAEGLASQMNPEAAEQFVSDMSSLECSVEGAGYELSFSLHPSQSYLLEYLKSHGVPVAGGDGGTAHNVDGSTYQSLVNPKLWGTELPWLELPVLDGEDEAKHIVEIMGSDAGQDAVNRSGSEIIQAVKPEVMNEVRQMIGGGI